MSIIQELKKLPFDKKYEPKLVKDVISPYTELISNAISNLESTPCMIFYSNTPGTGKTSMMKAIINETGCENKLLNISDLRGIDVVREEIKQYGKIQSMNGKKKIVALDEFDGMTTIAQESLKGVMDEYKTKLIFLLTCNNIDDVNSAIQSRCALRLEFKEPQKELILEKLKEICNNENIKFDEDGLNKLIENNYPSVRDMVTYLQRLKLSNLDVTIENIKKEEEIYNKVFNNMISGNLALFDSDLKLINQNTINVKMLNKYFFEKVIDIPDIRLKIELIKILCRIEISFQNQADRKVIFTSGLGEMYLLQNGK